MCVCMPYCPWLTSRCSARIDQLLPATQMVLKVATVLGHVFSRALLGAVFPVQEDKQALDGHLHRLLKLGIVREMSGDEMQFRSSLLRVMVYNRLLFEQRLKVSHIHTRTQTNTHARAHTHARVRRLTMWLTVRRSCTCAWLRSCNAPTPMPTGRPSRRTCFRRFI